MQQSTVNDIPELHQIRIDAEIDVAKGNPCLTYHNQYSPLLMSAAISYDKRGSGNNHKSTQQHVFGCSMNYEQDNEVYEIDKEEVEDMYQANNTHIKNHLFRRRNNKFTKPIKSMLGHSFHVIYG